MSKQQLKPEERKIKFSVTISPELFKYLSENFSNKSKYIEWLIEQDKNKK